MKYLEIRDSATFIVAAAFRFSETTKEAQWLLSRAGYGRGFDQSRYVMLIRLGGDHPTINHDSYMWGGSSTMTSAHQYIEDNFDSLQDGDVVDVEFITGRTSSKKLSERYDQSI